jgi:uncharacterized protein (TIGR02996 family)
MSSPSSFLEALEAALVADPDDLAAHMAYADRLMEQDDPRGDFIQVQLALEDPGRPAAERKRLKVREEELLAAHEREWLGELVPLLLATPEEERALLDAECYDASPDPLNIAYGWTRGWLDTFECDYLTVEQARTLGRAPIARLLHTLVWRRGHSVGRFLYNDGPDLPDKAEDWNTHPYAVLASTPAVRNIRSLQIGAEIDPEEWEPGRGEVFYRLTPLVGRMPRLAELSIFARLGGWHGGQTEVRRLFELPTLTNLRVLRYYLGYDYPLGALAANPALGRLERLLCYPDGRARHEGEWASVISGVYALATSPHLRSLSHLQLRRCGGGDDVIEDLNDSGVLKRLKMLDLRHGRVTDAGARRLASCPHIANLEVLDLVNNRLTGLGIAALMATRVDVRAEDQQRKSYDTRAIFSADIE